MEVEVEVEVEVGVGVEVEEEGGSETKLFAVGDGSRLVAVVVDW